VSLPLEGLLVVAFEQAVSAPICTRHLGDLGARVIKVENPNGGDFTRTYDDAVRGLAGPFVWLNRNKESLTLNTKHPASAEILDRLLSRADVAIQNLAPGAAARLGVDAASLVARYPRMVAVDISGYGVGGPLDHKRAYDLLAQSEGGSCAVTGTEGNYAKPGIPIADVGTGLYALSSILAALYARDRTGEGAAIAVSLFDTIAETIGMSLHYTVHTGIDREPNGVSSPAVAPYGAYATSDDAMVVLGTTNDAEWQRFATQLLDRPDLATDPRYATNQLRCQERDELDAVIAKWAATRTIAEVQAAADKAQIGNARFNRVSDLREHPQLVDRGRWVDVDSPVGAVPVVLPPPISSGWSMRLDAIPALGQHTEAVLADLGFDAAAIAAFRSDGVV
jgi:itaconate CoA-transferase